MKRIRDRVVGGCVAGRVDGVGGHLPPLLGVAEHAHQLHVLGRVDQLELGDRRRPRRKKVGVLDEACRPDQIDSELDSDGLERVLVRQLVLHERLAVDQGDRARHGNLR